MSDEAVLRQRPRAAFSFLPDIRDFFYDIKRRISADNFFVINTKKESDVSASEAH
ncbi:hypothetical protein [uncultured Duodenibacillus sp.]|uniref:hypothetical protein n=1 Tax=uncultured Duodenibacillus sp. TaxID=1980699 RepID=UPI00258E8A9F|nr:hypothetical protein [uncultured Duodenibacillus sp.]